MIIYHIATYTIRNSPRKKWHDWNLQHTNIGMDVVRERTMAKWYTYYPYYLFERFGGP